MSTEKEKAKKAKDGEKKSHHGLGPILKSLRKLSPPKRILPRSSSDGNADDDQGTTCLVPDEPPKSPRVPDVDKFLCPALNCFYKFNREDVMHHAKCNHSIVAADSPDFHANLIEVSYRDMTDDEGSAAWAPTLLKAFDLEFFFEAWRNANGRWYMWVYGLASPEECEGFIAELEVSNSTYKAAFSGPVFSLRTPLAKVTTSGKCLSFVDNLAKDMLRPLEEYSAVTGISYSVRIRKAEENTRL